MIFWVRETQKDKKMPRQGFSRVLTTCSQARPQCEGQSLPLLLSRDMQLHGRSGSLYTPDLHAIETLIQKKGYRPAVRSLLYVNDDN